MMVLVGCSKETVHIDFPFEVGDVENISKVTTEFLDILEVKEKKVSSLEEFSQEFRCAQMGVFGTDIENNSRLREYVSSVSNNNVNI